MEQQEVQLTEDSLRRLSIISISLISSEYGFLMPMFTFFLLNHPAVKAKVTYYGVTSFYLLST